MVKDRDFNPTEGRYLKIMNELADKLMTIKLSAGESQLLWMFFRMCYGYNNATCILNWSSMKDFTGLSKASLSRSLNGLKTRGIIKSSKNGTTGIITYKINSKISTWEVVPKMEPVPKMELNGSKNGTHTLYKNNKNIPPTPLKKSAHPAQKKDTEKFNLFWSRYPKKVDKKRAVKAWVKINPDDLLFKKIMSGLNDHIASVDWQKDSGQFIPYPASFLNGERWEDEVSINYIDPLDDIGRASDKVDAQLRGKI